MRNVKVIPVASKAVLDQRMTLLTTEAKPVGGVDAGAGTTLVIEHTTDNALMAFPVSQRGRDDVGRGG